MLQIDTNQQNSVDAQARFDTSKPPPSMPPVGVPPVGVPPPKGRDARGNLIEAPPSSGLQMTINVTNAFLRCMFNNTSGVMMSERDHPPKMCYFEVSDLNLEQPCDLLDMVMLLNRMEGIKVHFQARYVNTKPC